MDVTIRPMTPDDVPGKAHVHWQSWREAYANIIDPAWLNARTLAQCEDMARRFPDNTLVAVQDGRVVGFGVYGTTREADLPDYGELYALYVLASHHGKGIGFALMHACVAAMPGRPGIVLWVLEGNERAIRFYERHGFLADGRRQEITLGTPLMEQRMVYRASQK